MSNIAIYTCVTGGYDTPTDGFRRKEGYDYYLFTDTIIQTESWSVMLSKFNDDPNLSNVKKQRMIKTHPNWVLPEYDITVWIDANTDVDDKLYRYIQKHKDSDITFKIHPDRDCIYTEMKECVFFDKEKLDIAQPLFYRYMKEGYPEHNGLYETNIIISHPKKENVRTIFEYWWDEIYENSHRDQLSLNYVLWKHGLDKYVNAVKTYDFPPKQHIHI